MQIMLSQLAVYARNKHLIVNAARFEVVHFNSAGENVPVFNVGVVSQRFFLVSGHGFLPDLEHG